MAKMTAQQKKEWDELYSYVKTNVMGYDENQSLSRSMVLRLKGLCTNKFMENKNIKDSANYSYGIILLTFKFCSVDIQKALSKISFKDEMHRFNYILVIVEKNINTVYERMKKVEKANTKMNETDMSAATNKITANYQKKTEKCLNTLEDLW